jgi:hypothetical protein
VESQAVDAADQVILVLQVVLTIGPVAVYFLGLGLVSSQAYPCLVSERADFVLLAVAFVPVILWPVVALVTAGGYALTAILLAAVLLLFFTLLPARTGGWVIYNLSADECRQALQRACARLGWHMEPAPSGQNEEEMLIRPIGLTLMLASMPWLRNVTLRLKAPGGLQPGDSCDLLAALSREIRRESLLPSPTGAGLVVIGATLLGFPLWYLFHHMDSIVDVVRRILLA